MVAARPYHHGNLREALLERGRVVLRERGVGALSLRELARDVGVSHGAPRRHFPDRQALLDALALVGFARLGAALRGAVEQAPGEVPDQMRAAAHAYIAFATHDAELLELAADDAFSAMLELLVRGQADGILPAGDPERVGLIHLATIQGIASLVNAGMVAPEQVDGLVEDAVGQMLSPAVRPRRPAARRGARRHGSSRPT